MMKANLIFLILISAPLVRANVPCSDIDHDSKVQLLSGNTVKKITPIPGKPWPEVTIYSLVQATPEEAMSIFADIDAHKTYFPNVIESIVIDDIDPLTWKAKYILNLPAPFDDEEYTVEDRLSRNKTTYRLDWKMIEAKKTADIQGYVQFEILQNHTCMTYSNFVDPGRALGILKSIANKRVEKAAESLVNRIQSTEDIHRQIDKLRSRF